MAYLELGKRAAVTCFGPDCPLPAIRNSYILNPQHNTYRIRVAVDYLVKKDNRNPPVVLFWALYELNEEDEVEFAPIIPRTEKARAKYNCVW